MGQKPTRCDGLREPKGELKPHQAGEYFKMSQISPLEFNVKGITIENGTIKMRGGGNGTSRGCALGPVTPQHQ